ncbi:MAG: DUF4870 domain-containing protein [Vulcanimicrobiota bacterium]
MKLLPPLTDEDKMLSGLCYPLWPIAPAFILWSPKKDDPFLVYHAYQGLGFGGFASAATVVVFVVLSLMFRLLPGGSVLVPGMLGILTFGTGLLAFLGVFLVALFLGWRASAGDMFGLPLVGEWAEERMVMASGKTRQEFLQALAEPEVDRTQVDEKPEPYDSSLERRPWEGFQAGPTVAEPLSQAAPVPVEPPRPRHDSGSFGGRSLSPSQPRPIATPPSTPVDPATVRAYRARGERPPDENNLLRQWLTSTDDD